MWNIKISYLWENGITKMEFLKRMGFLKWMELLKQTRVLKRMRFLKRTELLKRTKFSTLTKFPIIVILLASFILLPACAKTDYKDLMEGVHAQAAEADREKIGEDAAAITDFTVCLFKACMAEDMAQSNTLLSPVSVLYALAMTANGAEGETLQQMESTFGLTMDELNSYLYAYRQALPSASKYKVNLANSIWYAKENEFQANPDFLQCNADYYDAGLYQMKLDDNAKKVINDWVKKSTDREITEIIDEVSPNTIMFLVNAVSFDAEWQQIYKENQIKKGEFTNIEGEKEELEFMSSIEFDYLEDGELATGFLKYYAEQKYAFAALLPAEGVQLEDYVASLTGEKLRQILDNPQQVAVAASMPKFTSESAYTMNDLLIQMGIKDAFDGELADFSRMGTAQGGIYIDQVFHKAKIEVNEKGTKAGAATAIAVKSESDDFASKEVHLNRPFLYLVIDCETKQPLFAGVLLYGKE